MAVIKFWYFIIAYYFVALYRIPIKLIIFECFYLI